MKQIMSTDWTMSLFWNLLFSIIATVTCDRNILETTIVTETNEAIQLRWVETEPLLANENLPVWEFIANSYLKQEVFVMKDLGKFRTFHDLEKSSAVVLIEKWNCIYGVIDVRYTIVCLPLDQLHGHQHKIGESPNLMVEDLQVHSNYGNKMKLPEVPSANDVATTSDGTLNQFKMLIKTYVNPDELIPHDRPMCSKHGIHYTKGRLEASHDGPPQKTQHLNRLVNYKEEVITVYPEILILISHEMIRHTSHLATIVLRYIVQLNAVAMLFAKLATHGIRIHINIAGLVIERFPHGFVPEYLFDNGNPSGHSLLNSATRFIKEIKLQQSGSRKAFAEDSVDMFLLSTTSEWQERAVNPGGFPTMVHDMMKMRKLRNQMRRVLGSVVDATNLMNHYVNAAREIAHLMTVEDDPLENHDSCVDEQCYSIMHASNRYCPNCLTWSQRSVQSFKKYLSENTNRCFLRNLPRSLHPYDRPFKTLIPADQCLCYGYQPLETTHLDSEPVYHVCNRILLCSPFGLSKRLHSTSPPIDGTPCNKDDNTQVCWRSRCV